jgi:hypothetical protein
MGYYIETSSFKNKAQWILEHCVLSQGMIRRPETVPEGFVPVCVVDNGPFEAAAIAYDMREAVVFDMPTDTRPKQWLLIRIEDAERLNPKVKGHINWNQPTQTNANTNR